jgi:predicted dehydrogenase
MIIHPSLSVLCVDDQDGSDLKPLLSYLQAIPHVQLAAKRRLPTDLTPYDVVVSSIGQAEGEHHRLERFARAGGGWLGLVDPPIQSLPELFGAQPGAAGPNTELRVYTGAHPLADRLPDHAYVPGQYRPLEKTALDAEVILSVDWRHLRTPVVISRPADEGRVACATLHGYGNPTMQQILYRLLRHLAGQAPREPGLGVGILGYSPAVGRYHGLGVEATTGLVLLAACDLEPHRLEEARQHFPHIKTYASTTELAGDSDVEVVVVATPPNTHARLAQQMMEAGKHVVCEKPLTLTRQESGALVNTAKDQEVHLGCYQNRRWDTDYLAIKQAMAEGLVGDLFYVETFVGGFEHPCGLWHSHEAISGGTTYDWGAHYLDWVLSLIPDPVISVIGTRHKRVWLDTTNADQERIQMRFAGGQEAEFLHSDIAAARKPKWYLLGTEGAIVGHWQDVTAYEIDPVHYFHEHEIPRTEMVPDLTLYSRHHAGRIVMQTLALPERQPFAFYRNLADHLLTGEPIVAPLEQSVEVVAVLEAASRSAAKGGTVEVLDG